MKKCLSLLLCALLLVCAVSCGDDPVKVYRTATNEYYTADSYRIVAESSVQYDGKVSALSFNFRYADGDWRLTQLMGDTTIMIATKVKDVIFTQLSESSDGHLKVRYKIDETEERAILRPWMAVLDVPELAADDMTDAKLVGDSSYRSFTATVDTARFDKYAEKLLYTRNLTDVTDKVTVEKVTYTAKIDYNGVLTGIVVSATASVLHTDGSVTPASFDVDLFYDTINSTHVNSPDDAAEYISVD